MSRERTDRGARVRRSGATRWVLGITVAIALLLVGLRVWWGGSAETSFEDAAKAIVARGEPLAWKDFAVKPVPDEDNAVELYERAGGHEAFTRIESVNFVLDLVAHPALRRKHAKKVAQFLGGAREPLALCRQARSCKGVDWKLGTEGPAIRWRVPPFRRITLLVEALCLAGLAAHDAGDDAAALESFRDALAIAGTVRHLPMLIGSLLASGAETSALQAIEQAAPQLAIGDGRRDARPEDVRRLIAELLDESKVREGFTRAMMGERSMVYDTVERLRRGEMSLSGIRGGGAPGVLRSVGVRLFLRPTFTSDGAFLLKHHTGYVAAARAASYPQAMAKAPVFTPPRSRWWALRRPLTAMLLASFGQVYKVHYRALAMRRATATALAIRLCERDHGRRPAKLADLVPKYLPAVPLDPFSKTHRALSYRPQAETPLLYSVFVNGQDDQGRFTVDAAGGLDRGKSADWPFFLDGNRPAPKPVPAPVAASTTTTTTTQAVGKEPMP